MSHLVNKAIRFLGPGVGNPIHQCGETVEVAIGAILEDVGIGIAKLAKIFAEDAHRRIVNEVDIRSAFQQWRETHEFRDIVEVKFHSFLFFNFLMIIE